MQDTREIDAFIMTPSCVSSSRTGPCILFIAHSLAEGGRGQAVSAGRAAILYTEMSGEEILQQWLDSHPEVVERHQKQLRKRGDRGRKEDRSETGQERDEEEVRELPQALQQTLYPSTAPDAKSATLTPDISLPLHLHPYSNILPPSLLPAPSRTAYPHTLLSDDTSGWG